MDESEKVVAAIYAAKVTWNEPANLNAFLGHYEACVNALAERQAAAKRAESERDIETWNKAGR